MIKADLEQLVRTKENQIYEMSKVIAEQAFRIDAYEADVSWVKFIKGTYKWVLVAFIAAAIFILFKA